MSGFNLLFLYSVLTSLVKIVDFFSKMLFEFFRKQKILNGQSNLKKDNKAESIMRPDFKLHYKARVIKIVHTGTKTGTQM